MVEQSLKRLQDQQERLIALLLSAWYYNDNHVYADNRWT